MPEPEVIEMSATENINSRDNFNNQAERQMKGTAGTLHITNEDNKMPIVNAAWELSKNTNLPVVIVVRAR